MSSIIEMITEAQRILDEAKYKIDVAIMKELYTYKQAKTLDDVYHNLEVLRRTTHSKIDKAFWEYQFTNHVTSYFDAYRQTGYLMVDRSKEEKKFHYFMTEGIKVVRPRQAVEFFENPPII